MHTLCERAALQAVLRRCSTHFTSMNMDIVIVLCFLPRAPQNVCPANMKPPPLCAHIRGRDGSLGSVISPQLREEAQH